jgi:hypothetical protein
MVNVAGFWAGESADRACEVFRAKALDARQNRSLEEAAQSRRRHQSI